jgi:hypothetical protein
MVSTEHKRWIADDDAAGQWFATHLRARLISNYNYLAKYYCVFKQIMHSWTILTVHDQQKKLSRLWRFTVNAQSELQSYSLHVDMDWDHGYI